jgi:hypothetical protein
MTTESARRPYPTNEAVETEPRQAAVNGGPTTSSNGNGTSYYEILGVGHQADTEELAEAYGRLRQRYHPENNPNDPLAREIVRYPDSAYGVLIDPVRRQAYDAGLANGASANGFPGHSVALRTNGAVYTNGSTYSRNGGAALAEPATRAARSAVAVEAESRPAPAVEVAPEAGGGGRGGRRKSAYADRDLTEGSVPKTLWFLAWPQMVSGSLQTLDTMVDLVLAGRGFGVRGIAGLGAAQSWSQVVMTARMGLDTAARAMVSRAVGAGDLLWRITWRCSRSPLAQAYRS